MSKKTIYNVDTHKEEPWLEVKKIISDHLLSEDIGKIYFCESNNGELVLETFKRNPPFTPNNSLLESSSTDILSELKDNRLAYSLGDSPLIFYHEYPSP